MGFFFSFSLIYCFFSREFVGENVGVRCRAAGDSGRGIGLFLFRVIVGRGG